MLILEGKKVSRKELANLFGVDLQKVEKQPSFELDKSKVSKDKANGGGLKVNAGTSIRARFYVDHPQTGVPMEVRYAKSESQEVVGNQLKPSYKPYYVPYFKKTQDGSQTANIKFSFQDDLDLALYFYLHPQNRFSPLRPKDKKSGIGYEFIDTKARALNKMSLMNKKADAMEHAKNIEEFKMVILCKGLGFKGVDSKDAGTLRADLLEFALNKADVYMDAVNTGIVHTEGLIINLIDRGVLKLDKIHGVRQWSWTSGDREGEIVGGQITNPSQDAKAFIKTYILNNIHTYNVVLNSITDNMKAKEKAKEFFIKQQEESNTIGDALPDHLRQINQEVDTDPLPTNFQEAKDYLERKGYKKIPANVKTFNDAVQDGSVTKDNVSSFLRELCSE